MLHVSVKRNILAVDELKKQIPNKDIMWQPWWGKSFWTRDLATDKDCTPCWLISSDLLYAVFQIYCAVWTRRADTGLGLSVARLPNRQTDLEKWLGHWWRFPQFGSATTCPHRKWSTERAIDQKNDYGVTDRQREREVANDEWDGVREGASCKWQTWCEHTNTRHRQWM